MARDDWEWVTRIPKIRMLKEPKRRVRFLKREEADRLLEELPGHLVPVVRFALATGCRMREILQMEWSRVDFDRRVAWLDAGTTQDRRQPRHSPEPGCTTGVEGHLRSTRTMVLHVSRETHGSSGLSLETGA